MHFQNHIILIFITVRYFSGVSSYFFSTVCEQTNYKAFEEKKNSQQKVEVVRVAAVINVSFSLFVSLAINVFAL